MNDKTAEDKPQKERQPKNSLKEAERKTAEEHQSETTKNTKRQEDDTYVAEEIGVKP